MRILHVVPTYYPATRYGGPIRSVHGLCKSLAANGDDVVVYTTNANGSEKLDLPVGTPVERDGVELWYFDVQFPKRLYYSRELRKKLKKTVQDFDVIHLHAMFSYPTTMAARYARLYDVPYVMSTRGMLVANLLRNRSRYVKKAWIEMFDKNNLEKASAVHVTTRIEAREVNRFKYDFKQVSIIPHGVEPPVVTHPEGSPDSNKSDEMGVLFIGRLAPVKGLTRLIDALEILSTLRATIAGPDENDHKSELIDRAMKKGVRNRIIFTGELDDDLKERYLNHAQVFVLPSISESFGIAALEAMSMGIPVVVSRGVGLADEIQSFGCGVVFDGSAASLASALWQVISNPYKARVMGQRGKRLVEEKYSWQIQGQKMRELYHQTLRHSQQSVSFRKTA